MSQIVAFVPYGGSLEWHIGQPCFVRGDWCRILVFVNVLSLSSNPAARRCRKAELRHGCRISAGCDRFSKYSLRTFTKSYIRNSEPLTKHGCPICPQPPPHHLLLIISIQQSYLNNGLAYANLKTS